jgi:hypothetical protein
VVYTADEASGAAGASPEAAIAVAAGPDTMDHWIGSAKRCLSNHNLFLVVDFSHSFFGLFYAQKRQLLFYMCPVGINRLVAGLNQDLKN